MFRTYLCQYKFIELLKLIDFSEYPRLRFIKKSEKDESLYIFSWYHYIIDFRFENKFLSGDEIVIGFKTEQKIDLINLDFIEKIKHLQKSMKDFYILDITNNSINLYTKPIKSSDFKIVFDSFIRSLKKIVF